MRRLSNTLLFAALIAIAGLLAWQHQSKLYEDKGKLRVEIFGQTAVLAWDSEVELPMARRLKEAFNTSKDQVNRFVLSLNSPGGSLSEGGKVVEFIAEMKRSHQVDTFVGAKGACLSMCVPIFLQGQSRIAAPTSTWMFHKPRYVAFLTGETVDKPEFEKEYFAKRFFERYFERSEINPAWRARLGREWQDKDVWKTGQQLFDEQANIITELSGDT